MNEQNLSSSVFFDEVSDDIKHSLIKIGSISEEWMEIFENKITGQLWVIDIFDKYQPRVAIKIGSIEEIKDINFEIIRKELLLKSRGGIDDGLCIMKDCNKNRVKGVVYCIDHLYEIGTRK